VSFWGALRGLFVPRVPSRRLRSPFDGDPEQARKERPLRPSTTTRWYQADIECAILEADQGRLQTAARLCRAFRRDGTVFGLRATRAGGLIRLPKRFRGSPQAIAALESIDELGVGGFDAICSGKELEALAADGVDLGVGVGELLRIPGRIWPVFVRLDPEFLRYDWSEDRWYYQAETGLLPVTPGDGRWVLHTPGGYQQPWSNGLWPGVARAFVSKDHAFHYRENYSGKLANPARVAVAPNGATEAQRQSWFAKVMAWGVNTVFGMTPGYDVKLLESNGRGYEVFADTIETCDREIALAYAGQVVTVDGGAGFANANIHALIRSDLIQGDGDALAHTVNTQILAPIVGERWGFGCSASVQWDTRPPPALEAEAKAMLAAADAVERANAVLAPYGLRVDAREIATRYRIPVLTSEPAGAVAALPAADPANDAAAVDVDVSELDDDAHADVEADAAPDDAPVEPSAAEALAAKMSEYQVPRCEHGYSNRCWRCGVERLRDFEPGPDGAAPRWAVKWRAIAPEVAA